MLFDDPSLRQLKQKFVSEKVRKEGFVKATDRGFGFLEADRESFFIAPNDMRSVMHGDRIVCTIDTDPQGKSRAVPEKLVDSFLKRFIGRILYAGGKLCVVPDHPNISAKIQAVDKRQDKSAKLANGDWVVCNLASHALKSGSFKTDITEFICPKDDPKTPWTVSLRRYDLPLKEPDDKDFSFNEDNLSREDLTLLPFVTIDSGHTEDMDDALYITKDELGYKLYVAIADPTGYIKEHSPEDKLAALRAFSIYLPGRDIPMLPRVLAEDLCSLRPNQIRPALVGVIKVLSDGSIDANSTVFKLALVKSHGKLVYNEVSDYLEGKNTAFKPDNTIAKVLSDLVEFTKIRDRYRSEHAAPFKNRPDYDFVLKENGALDHIEINFRRIANQIVEESMIAANICAGEVLAKAFNTGIFNIHKGFDLAKKADIVKLLISQHCPFDENSIATLEGYNAIRRFAANSGNDYLDSRIRKLQEYSQMSIVPGPHFALGVNRYATWTSPIRKYGDMVNHRLLKSLITGNKQPEIPDDDLLLTMNNARRTNRMAERDVKDWLYVEFLEPEIEKKTIFNAYVFDISRGGLRVVLEENGAMIFIPSVFISANKDAFELNGDSGELFVNHEVKLKLGDNIKVRIAEVNKTTRSITGFPAEPIGGLLLPDLQKIRKGAKPAAKRHH